MLISQLGVGLKGLKAGQLITAIVRWMQEVDQKERLIFLAMLKAVIS